MNKSKVKGPIKLFVVLAAGFLAGILLSSLQAVTAYYSFADGLASGAAEFFQKIFPWPFLVINLTFILYALWEFKRVKAGYTKKPDEEIYLLDEKLEELFGEMNLMTQIDIFFLYNYLLVVIPREETTSVSSLILALAALIFYALYGRKVLFFLREKNPEKQGDPLDFSFRKTLIGSMDEGEKYKMYRAGHKAGYRAVCVAAILFITLLFFFPEKEPRLFTGIYLGIVFFTYQITYYAEGKGQN